MDFYSSVFYERDVLLDEFSAVIIRGCFPPVSTWPKYPYSSLRCVKNSFHNLTNIKVPSGVSALLSFGPKFMLPSFTLMSQEESQSMWEEVLSELEDAGYATVRYRTEHECLKLAFDEHVGDHNYVSLMSRKLLVDAYATDNFLRTHLRQAILVEGDKGKVVGLLPRPYFIHLVDSFIDEGIACGRFVEYELADEVSYLKSVEEIYLQCIAPFDRLQFNQHNQGEYLFVPSPQDVGSLRKVIKMNAFVRQVLTHAEWGVPVFRPTVKFHKDPVKIRPVISKRNTPSISVGRIVRFALERVMKNYFSYDAKLNVYRVEDLTEELFSVYVNDPSYGFCSIDVVSMFDRISMDGVRAVISNLDMRFSGGIINLKLLQRLVTIDCNFFDFFKYTSPEISRSPVVRYFHQKQGIFMGGNTSTLYADLYTSYHVSRLFLKLRQLGVRLIRKYVDDFLIYAPKENFVKIVALISEATNLEFTIEHPREGVLPYLDLLIRDIGGKLSTSWYRKSITSERLVNFHSSVPSHELINTFTMRFVVASRYDSGGSFMESFFVILCEMFWNSVPRRLMRVCLNRACRYFLGRKSASKISWLKILAIEVYHLVIGQVTMDDFLCGLQRRFLVRGYDFGLFIFEHDSTTTCQFRNHPTREFHVPGDPINILPYRGRQSVRLFKELRSNYSDCTTVFKHDRYYSIRRLTHRGLEHRSARERKQRRALKASISRRNC